FKAALSGEGEFRVAVNVALTTRPSRLGELRHLRSVNAAVTAMDEPRLAFATTVLRTAGHRLKGRTMYKQILISNHASELAGRAVATGLTLGRALKARVTAVTATEPWSAMVMGEPALVFPIEEYEKAAAENAGRILSGVSSSAEEVSRE